MTRGLIVVGASLAGVRTIEGLRRRGYSEPITLIGAESHLPYDRPPLSKQFLFGDLQRDDLDLVTSDDLARLDVDLRLGERAIGLDVALKRLSTDVGDVFYDTLVIATGAHPRRLAAVPEAHVLRTVEDAEHLRGALEAGGRLAIVGGGVIGCEIASGARRFGLEVTIVEPMFGLMSRVLGPKLSTVAVARHAADGIRVVLGRTAVGLDDTGRHLMLEDGTAIEADVVVAAVGTEPNVAWLDGSGLTVRDGILCDADLRAAPGVLAVGDVAAPEGRRAEHWTSTIDQAAIAVSTVLGTDPPVPATSYLWSDQLDLRLQIAGDRQAGDSLHYLSGSPDAGEFTAAFVREGRYVAVASFGDRAMLNQTRRLVSTAAEFLLEATSVSAQA